MDWFSIALAEVLRWEGRCGHHPDDPGGATCYGITQATYNAWRRSRGEPPQPVYRIQDWEVRAIYRERYWAPVAEAWARKDRPGVALYLFDSAVQHGVLRAQEWATRFRDVLWLYPLEGLGHLNRERVEFYTRLKHFSSFGRGWMRRVARIMERAVELEQPEGLIRAKRLFLDGAEQPLEKARRVGDKLYIRRKP